MEPISQEIIDILKEQFLNKRVSIEDGNGQKWVGDLNFIGYNSFFPNWGLCATIDRTPIQGVQIKSIHLRPLQESIFKK